MASILKKAGALCVLLCSLPFAVSAERLHPKLLINSQDVANMREAKDSVPEFREAFLQIESSIDAVIEGPMDVPVPKDAGGGYTHEQHKRNYKAIRDAGLMFQITGEKRYLEFARKMLFAYAELYPTLGPHPKKKELAPGRLFWQTLNESVWLVYTIQGYDLIASALSDADRQTIEQQLLRPVAKFLSEDSPRIFNKVHNHGTWAVAAVGMTGYVLNDKDMVEKALLGLDKSGKSGFLKQLDQLFSPDGYYTEGPYYQRYALMPFILFGKAIEYNDPSRKIFEYRNEILIKAVYTTIQLSYANFFFPINDAIKDKGLDTIELIHGLAIVYGLTGDSALLSIAKQQHTISVSGDGVKVAQGLMDKTEKPFPFRSMQLRDGAKGDQGALSILRSGYEAGHMAIVAKNTSQGLGHGHYDKLAMLIYDNGSEVVSDYGGARFLNIESKYGGHYLLENDTWAKQTIAHNTVVVDETSHSGGDYHAAKDLHPDILLFDATEKVHISSAQMRDAYDDVAFTRTIAMVGSTIFDHPLILDVLKLESDSSHQYDLPLYYQGHIVNITFPIEAQTSELKPFGEKNGYQFLWAKAEGAPQNELLPQVTWLLDNRFYSLSAIRDNISTFHFVELGANDPNFNLRRESGIVRRAVGAKDYTFVSALESHGEYNPSLEFTHDSYSAIANIEHFSSSKGYDYVRVRTKSGKSLGLAIAYDTKESKSHKMKVDGKTVKWKGFYKLFEG